MSLTNQIALGCTSSASTTTCGTIASAVLIRIWHLEMLTLWKNKPIMSSKSERIPFSLHGSRKGPCFFFVFFLSVFFFVLGFSVAVDSCNYGCDVLGDCPFTCCSVLLPLFPIEQASEILPGQVCHLAFLPS